MDREILAMLLRLTNASIVATSNYHRGDLEALRTEIETRIGASGVVEEEIAAGIEEAAVKAATAGLPIAKEDSLANWGAQKVLRVTIQSFLDSDAPPEAVISFTKKELEDYTAAKLRGVLEVKLAELKHVDPLTPAERKALLMITPLG